MKKLIVIIGLIGFLVALTLCCYSCKKEPQPSPTTQAIIYNITYKIFCNVNPVHRMWSNGTVFNSDSVLTGNSVINFNTSVKGLNCGVYVNTNDSIEVQAFVNGVFQSKNKGFKTASVFITIP